MLPPKMVRRQIKAIMKNVFNGVSFFMFKTGSLLEIGFSYDKSLSLSKSVEIENLFSGLKLWMNDFNRWFSSSNDFTLSTNSWLASNKFWFSTSNSDKTLFYLNLLLYADIRFLIFYINFFFLFWSILEVSIFLSSLSMYLL